VRFYAYLNKLVDGHIVTVLDKLEETGLMDETIILRIADHGEGGLSHGMREKADTVYEEMRRSRRAASAPSTPRPDPGNRPSGPQSPPAAF
jgi:arylsulfatase A-like enzyme